VNQPCRYAPEPNATYAEMARHYGCAVLPARPYKPKDKAKAEVAVQVVERWVLARLRHHRFHSLAALNQAIAELLESLNSRPFQRQSYSRRDLFESIDRPALRPLPLVPYEYAEWKQVKPGIDYHVELDGRLYSVPHALVGQLLELRATATSVEMLHRGRRVAVHPRQSAGRFSTLPEHMPKSHREHRQWSPGRFMNWAKDIGVATLHVVEHQLRNRPHPEHGYRACLGLLNLARRYSRARLEAACERALAIHSPTYRSVRSILETGLDQQPHAPAQDSDGTLPTHGNVRGPGYYN
jgi:transposase